MTHFEIRILNSENKFEDYIFACKKSEAAHKKLKSFAGTSTYYFEGLRGADWQRGGFYNLDCGFINPSPNIHNNVQGVVYEGEVYLLKKVFKKIVEKD